MALQSQVLKIEIRSTFHSSSVNIALFHFEQIQTIQNHKRTINDFNCTIEYLSKESLIRGILPTDAES